jgi:hypothetical protein
MNATFKPRHTNIHWILPWGIETLVHFENKATSSSVDWLFSVETYNNSYKTLHAHNWNEETWIFQNKVVEHIVKVSIEKATLILHAHVTYGIDNLDETGHAWMVQNQQHSNMTYKIPLPFTNYVCCTCEWALCENLCKHQVVVFLTCTNFTKENILQ